ncbi:MAG TPA: TIGR04563 family protein [Polyangia bacterium]|nr:TIGR04563 family protein [Polyangia bacterium]
MIPRGQKRSFYFPIWMSRELAAEAARLDRSISWILQRAWRLARAELLCAAPRGGDAPPAHPVGNQDGKVTPE